MNKSIESIIHWKQALDFVRDELGAGEHYIDAVPGKISLFKDAAARYAEATGKWHIRVVQMTENHLPVNRMKIMVADHSWHEIHARIAVDRSAERELIDALQPGQSVEIKGGGTMVQYVRNYVSGKGEYRVQKTPDGCEVHRLEPGKVHVSPRREIMNRCAAVAEGFTDCIELDAGEWDINYVRQIAYSGRHGVSILSGPGVIKIVRRDAEEGTIASMIQAACDRAVIAGSVCISLEGTTEAYVRSVVSKYSPPGGERLTAYVKRTGECFIMNRDGIMSAINACAAEQRRAGTVRPETRDRLKGLFQTILNEFKTA